MQFQFALQSLITNCVNIMDTLMVGALGETQMLARQLMLSISIIVVFQATNSIMTKGVCTAAVTPKC